MSTPKIYLTGEAGSPMKSVTRKPVDINEIRKKYNKNKLFEDPDFPAAETSLGAIGGDKAAETGKAAKVASMVWCRPHELAKAEGVAKPSFAAAQDKLAADELCSEYDLKQGGLGNCWYIAALQALVSRRQDQVKLVIPEDNFSGFDDNKYCGAFHFRFYDVFHGKWVDVDIDDRIPSVGPEGRRKPAFTQIKPNSEKAKVVEFWPALIEKAFAKYFGCYARIEGGFAAQGLENLTGGFAGTVSFADDIDERLFVKGNTKRNVLGYQMGKCILDGNFVSLSTFQLDKAHAAGALDGYTNYKGAGGKNQGYKYNEATKKIESDPNSQGKGLCKGHAYTILDVKEVKDNEDVTHFLVKIKNPHARHEWSGRYCDADNKGWAKLKQDFRTKNAEGSKQTDEGIFWMQLEDVLKYFKGMQMCLFEIGYEPSKIISSWPAGIQDKDIKMSPAVLKYFKAFVFQAGQDPKGVNAVNRGVGFADKAVIFVSLVMGGFNSKSNPAASFNFYIYKLDNVQDVNNLEKIYKTKKPEIVGGWNVHREVNMWTTVDPGSYVIIPVLYTHPNAKSTIPPEWGGKDIPFSLRVFSELPTAIILVDPPVKEGKAKGQDLVDVKGRNYWNDVGYGS